MRVPAPVLELREHQLGDWPCRAASRRGSGADAKSFSQASWSALLIGASNCASSAAGRRRGGAAERGGAPKRYRAEQAEVVLRIMTLALRCVFALGCDGNGGARRPAFVTPTILHPSTPSRRRSSLLVTEFIPAGKAGTHLPPPAGDGVPVRGDDMVTVETAILNPVPAAVALAVRRPSAVLAAALAVVLARGPVRRDAFRDDDRHRAADRARPSTGGATRPRSTPASRPTAT